MKKFVFFIFIVCGVVNAQLILFPGDLNIQPFTANFLEPKLGFLFQTNQNELRLDVGNSLDIIKYTLEDNTKISFGADFFTYTLLRGEKDFHFPVDAVDYLFGINAGYKKIEENFEYGSRLRFSHISAHFVDGHFDPITNSWRDGLNPKVYSREFFELIPYIRYEGVRLYAGYTYLIHVDPTDIGKNVFQFGFDYFLREFSVYFVYPFIGYDLRLEKYNKYSSKNNITAGVKIGYSKGKGISLYYNYFSGRSIHGEYFFKEKNYSAFGVNLDL